MRFYFSFICSFLLFITICAHGQSIYVSPSGSDKNPGTKTKPYKTLVKAQQKLRLLRKKAGAKNINIFLSGGAYHLSSPLKFSAADGDAKFTTTFSALTGQKVIISGAKKIQVKWARMADGKYQAKIPAEIGMFDQLYIHQKLQVLARYPNIDSSAQYFHGSAADALSPERVKRWKNPAGGFVHAIQKAQWGSVHYKILNKNADNSLKLEGGWQDNRRMGMDSAKVFVENVFEELDAPNEWFFDAEKKVLFYQPADGKMPENDIEIPQIENLLALEGTAEKPVQNIVFKNLTFAQTLRTFMKTREPLLRSDWSIYRNGAVFFNGTQNCHIQNSTFDRVGGNAVFFNNFNRESSVSACYIFDAGASGICFVGDPKSVRSPLFAYGESNKYNEIDKTPGPKSTNFPQNCSAKNNLIEYIGQVEKQSAGVEIAMSQNILIDHNTIDNVPRAGINIGDGTWGGHQITHNDVFHTVMETGDHGAFNSWGRDRYWLPNRKKMDSLAAAHPELILLDAIKITSIAGNRFQCAHGWDIDLDDGSSNYHIYNNVCLEGGLKLREGFYRTVENNILINNAFHPHVWFKNSGDIFRHNIVSTSYKPIQIKYWGKEIDANFFLSKSALEAAKLAGTDAHSAYGDARFVNAHDGNYAVKSASAALKTGFKNFTMDFGVTNHVLKNRAQKVRIPALKQSDENATIQTKNWLGATVKNVETLGEQSAAGLPDKNGVLFISVSKNSEAEKLGLQTGDVMIKQGEKMVKNLSDLPAETPKNILIFRNQEKKQIGF